ncbi:MAG: non-homologous end-joining DNA ligase [Propionibacteriaceae bacterium]
MAGENEFAVDGRRLRVTNLDKVLYPETGTTKGDVLAYLVEVADALLPHARERPVTRKRWVHGVGTADRPGQVFFHKDLTSHPDWVTTRTIEHSDGAKTYPLVNDRATLVWLGQLDSLEIHVPQWRFSATGSPQNPDRIVLDLDPGDGIGLAECVAVARAARALCREVGLDPMPVTSGSKGLHLYAALDGDRTSSEVSEVAHAIARTLEEQHPDLVTSQMKRSLRAGKVFIDWSQNAASKTTIAPYSLRGRLRPRIATPRTWAELDDDDLHHLEFPEVLALLAERPDPLAALLDPDAPRPMAEAAGTPDPRPPSAVPPSAVPPITVRKATGAPRTDETPGPAAPRYRPMLATASDHLPTGSGWAVEMKWDGIRALVECTPEGTRLFSRKGNDLSPTYPELADVHQLINASSAVLDAEIVALHDGRPDFEQLQQRMNLSKPADVRRMVPRVPVSLMVFDVLEIDGHSLVESSWSERRGLLAEVVTEVAGRVAVPPVFDGAFDDALATSRALRLEGVIAKRVGSRYLPGRRVDTWLKIKHRLDQEVIVVGWRDGSGRRNGRVGSLLLAVPGPGGDLNYAGRVGTGFSDADLDALAPLLEQLAHPTPPLDDVPREDARDAHWVRPERVGEVEHVGWSRAARLRHPAWRGWRPDKAPDEVRRENPR